MATVNKEQALLDWAAQAPLLKDPLLLDYLGPFIGSCALSPLQGEAVQRQYINRDAVKVYDFALQMIRPVSQATDKTNAENMYIQRQWGAWIEAQNEAQNFPDFGPKCSDFKLELLSNMPMLAEIYEDGTGKYQFFARLNYKEAYR